ncbi:hypothetical protein Goklo_023073 [Gossypium klotzschianum]|uniref:Uncharacterized protein n=1 Tax=Gossypium klotzschianum TaxID=34286 RepID=A0A7J8TPH8_9ROSI|nr:hypothetical protein [Gossypium klotzschianum]
MGDADGSNVDRNTKKVRFKDIGDDSAENMVVDTALASKISWKDKLLGRKNTRSLASSKISDGATDVDLKFEDGDILKSTINGILTIDFSKRIKKILVKDMETTNVVKLLGAQYRKWSSLQSDFQSLETLPTFSFNGCGKQLLFEEIESLVEKLAKMDIKTDSGGRGQFTRMVVFVDLEKSLTSQVLVSRT